MIIQRGEQWLDFPNVIDTIVIVVSWPNKVKEMKYVGHSIVRSLSNIFDLFYCRHSYEIHLTSTENRHLNDVVKICWKQKETNVDYSVKRELLPISLFEKAYYYNETSAEEPGEKSLRNSVKIYALNSKLETKCDALKLMYRAKETSNAYLHAEIWIAVRTRRNIISVRWLL